jgi:hypothetical protein
MKCPWCPWEGTPEEYVAHFDAQHSTVPYGTTPRSTAAKASYRLAIGDEQSAGIIGFRPESQKLVWMSPTQFLNLVVPRLSYIEETMRDLKEKMKSGKELDALWLDIDINSNRVTNHEGRHRARAAQDLGIEKVPVVLFAKDGYEWAPANMLPPVEKIKQQPP